MSRNNSGCLCAFGTEHSMFAATERLLDAGLSDAAWV